MSFYSLICDLIVLYLILLSYMSFDSLIFYFVSYISFFVFMLSYMLRFLFSCLRQYDPSAGPGPGPGPNLFADVCFIQSKWDPP